MERWPGRPGITLLMLLTIFIAFSRTASFTATLTVGDHVGSLPCLPFAPTERTLFNVSGMSDAFGKRACVRASCAHILVNNITVLFVACRRCLARSIMRVCDCAHCASVDAKPSWVCGQTRSHLRMTAHSVVAGER